MSRILKNILPGFIYIHETADGYSVRLLFGSKRPTVLEAFDRFYGLRKATFLDAKTKIKFSTLQAVFLLSMSAALAIFLYYLYKTVSHPLQFVWALPVILVAFIVVKIFRKFLLFFIHRSPVREYGYTISFDSIYGSIFINGDADLFRIEEYTPLNIAVGFSPLDFNGHFEEKSPAVIDETSVFVHVREKVDAYRERNHIEYRSGLRQSQVNLIIRAAGDEHQALTAGLNEVLNLMRQGKHRLVANETGQVQNEKTGEEQDLFLDILMGGKKNTDFNPMD